MVGERQLDRRCPTGSTEVAVFGFHQFISQRSNQGIGQVGKFWRRLSSLCARAQCLPGWHVRQVSITGKTFSLNFCEYFHGGAAIVCIFLSKKIFANLISQYEPGWGAILRNFQNFLYPQFQSAGEYVHGVGNRTYLFAQFFFFVRKSRTFTGGSYVIIFIGGEYVHWGGDRTSLSADIFFLADLHGHGTIVRILWFFFMGSRDKNKKLRRIAPSRERPRPIKKKLRTIIPLRGVLDLYADLRRKKIVRKWRTTVLPVNVLAAVTPPNRKLMSAILSGFCQKGPK